jgi:ubiquinone/menaquinone biosynthesis C-methylase UbiE
MIRSGDESRRRKRHSTGRAREQVLRPTVMNTKAVLSSALLILFVAVGEGQRAATPADIKQAEADIPRLADLLDLKPGMNVADIGAGFGATTIVMAKWLGPASRVFASDIAPVQLAALREATVREHLDNVTVIEGSDRSTNLPDACCDAIIMRDVYHHLTRPEEMDRSVLAALRPTGRLAIIDFEPEPGSKLPDGVPANRAGHGIAPTIVVDEVHAAGLTHVKTISNWPPNSNPADYFLVLFVKP